VISCHKHNLKPSPVQYIYPISYKIAKKGKPDEMDLPLLKNDITTIFYGDDTCVLLQIHEIRVKCIDVGDMQEI
jgi:hypothetical protein